MQFDQSLTDEKQPGDPEHDPAGDAIQCHELDSGELLLTFSPEWAEQQGYQIGDTVRFIIDDKTGGLQIINVSKGEREAG